MRGSVQRDDAVWSERLGGIGNNGCDRWINHGTEQKWVDDQKDDYIYSVDAPLYLKIKL